MHASPDGRLPLADEYLTAIRQVAPPLQGKNIEAFAHWNDHAVDSAFAYNNDQAYAAIGNRLARVWTGKTSPLEAVRQAARQANAVEVAGASTAKAAVVESKRFPTQGPDVAVVPLGI